jgi:CBS domain-containing protein
MLVKDLMTTDIATISPMASVREAVTTMRERDVKSLVTEKRQEDDAYGIITYTSIVRAIVAEDGDIDLLNVYDIYIKPAIGISRDVAVRHAARMMIQQRVKRLLVIDDNRLEGMVSMSDIVQNVLTWADARDNH